MSPAIHPSSSCCGVATIIVRRRKRLQQVPSSWVLVAIVIAFLSSSSSSNNNRNLVLVNANIASEQRCGDCWCIVHGDNELQECPTDTTATAGITDSFSNDYSIYGSFIQTNAIIELQSSDGNVDCFPFKDVLGGGGDLHNYPESNWPQCEIPTASTDTTAVCAYLYEESSSSFDQCQEGRKYELVTYNSVEEANAVGAIVTHKGACGVCSNAQDLWARMNTLDTFEDDAATCIGVYSFSTDTETKFQKLVDCAKVSGGFTDQCAKLWAHYGATTVAHCGTRGDGYIEGCTVLELLSQSTNGPPPQCNIKECLSCSFGEYYDVFEQISGRTLHGSGILEPIALPCSQYFPVVHDPCAGTSTTTFANPPNAAPTFPPVGYYSNNGSSSGAEGTIRSSGWRLPLWLLTTVAMLTKELFCTFGN